MSDDEFEPLQIDDRTMTQPGRDQARYRCYYGTWSKWADIEGKPAPVVAYVAEMPAHYEWQFRRRRQATASSQSQPPEPEQLATVDRGERYQRRIYQSIDGPGKGLSIVVDLADVFYAFQVPYMLGQAVKKSVLPGDRGAKDRLKDLREAAWHIQRQIQIEEARAKGGD